MFSTNTTLPQGVAVHRYYTGQRGVIITGNVMDDVYTFHNFTLEVIKQMSLHFAFGCVSLWPGSYRALIKYQA